MMSSATTPIASVSIQPCPLVPAASTPGLKKAGSLSSPLGYGIANEQNELSEAFGLVYESYLRAGLVVPNANEVRVTPFHLLPTTEVMVTKYESRVVSTVSLIGDGYLGLPLQGIYPAEVLELRKQNLRMAELGCLADRRNSPVRFIETFAAMGRMVAQVAMTRGYDGLVTAVHPKHARLYKRILPFEQIGDLNECPYANGNPAVMLSLVFEDYQGTNIYERFFGSMAGTLDVAPRPWSKQTRGFFKGFLQTEQECREGVVRGQLAFAALTGQYPG